MMMSEEGNTSGLLLLIIVSILTACLRGPLGGSLVLVMPVMFIGCICFPVSTITLLFVQITVGSLLTFVIFRLSTFLRGDDLWNRPDLEFCFVMCLLSIVILLMLTLLYLLEFVKRGYRAHYCILIILLIGPAELIMYSYIQIEKHGSYNYMDQRWEESIKKATKIADVITCVSVPVCTLSFIYLGGYSSSIVQELSIVAEYVLPFIEFVSILYHGVYNILVFCLMITPFLCVAVLSRLSLAPLIPS